MSVPLTRIGSGKLAFQCGAFKARLGRSSAIPYYTPQIRAICLSVSPMKASLPDAAPAPANGGVAIAEAKYPDRESEAMLFFARRNHASRAVPMDRSRVTTAFLNLGHFLDHLAMLIYATAVLVMTREFGLRYEAMLPLSLGAFIAFGAGSLPSGWLGDRYGRRAMMIVFFFGLGAALILAGLARSAWQIVAALTLVGTFASIYHPVGIAMLVKNQPRVGRVLGWNGVWGNLGLAFASLIAGWFADHLSWRAAFIAPGLFTLGAGLAFVLLVPASVDGTIRGRSAVGSQPLSTDARRIFAILTVATMCSGVIFAAATNAMPKIFDERLAALVHSTAGIGTLVATVYIIAATAQLVVGQLIDRYSLRSVFLVLAAAQVPLLLLAGALADWAMLGVAVAMMFVIFGIIPINDAMVARYAEDAWRSRVYALRYVVSFGASLPAIPLVAYLQPQAGGFSPLFAALAAIGLGTLAAALLFPTGQPRPAPAPAAAE
jgi:MFS family permease